MVLVATTVVIGALAVTMTVEGIVVEVVEIVACFSRTISMMQGRSHEWLYPGV